MNGWLAGFAEPWVERLGWVLLHFLWEGTALALLLAVALRLLARASSHIRYLVIGGALLLCGVMPVVTWWMLEPVTMAVFAPGPGLPEPAAVPVTSGVEVKAVDMTAAGSMEETDLGWTERWSRGAAAALPYVVALWLGGVLILTLRLTLGWTLMQRLCRCGSPVRDEGCRERFERLLERMRVGVPVRLLESARVEVPTLIGWLRPTILVPTSVFIGLSPAQLEAILAHELAHVRRYDYLVNLFQTVIETILFYHPAVWWISGKLREERENCCDDLALEVMQDRLVYASALAQLEEGRALPLAMTASGGSLLQRIRRIAGANDRKASAWPLWVLGMAILSLACLSKTKAAATTAVSTSPAATDATGKDDAMMIRTGLKVVRIDEDEYQAHRAAIDDAVQRGDMTPLTQLKSFDLLSSPAVLAKAGERGVLEAVRVLPYSAGVAQDPSSNGNPTDYLGNGDYKRQNLGLRFVIFPTFIDGKINLKGDLNLTRLEGWTRISEKTHRPNFHVREASVSESFVSGQTKGFAMPGGAQMEPADPSVAYFPDKIPDASQNPKSLRRIFFFLNEQAFHRDGQRVTEQSVKDRETKTVTPVSKSGDASGASVPTAEEMKAVEDSQTPLIKALLGRQYDQARALLAQGADCNATDKLGLSPLGALIEESGDDGRFPFDILQTILARTRDRNPSVPVEFCTPPMSTPLLEDALFGAAYSNGSAPLKDDRRIVKLLLAHGARFASAPDDVQPLLQAAALDDLPEMQQLVAKGISPSAADGDGWTPLLISIALDYDDAANFLIDHGANVSAPTRRGAEDPLLFATAHANDALVEKLIAKGAKPVLRGGDLWRAVDRNDQRLFDDLINAGADPKGNPQIHGSAGGQYFRQIDSDPLFICIARGQTAMALTLIAKGEDPEPANVFQNRNFAYWAVYHDRPQILQALLDHGANPLLKTDAGETPLSLAQKSHPDLVPILQAAAKKRAPESSTSNPTPTQHSVYGHLFVQNPSPVDYAKSQGELVSVDGDKGHVYPFTFQADGSFIVADAAPGKYNISVHLVRKNNADDTATDDSIDETLAQLTVDAATAKRSYNVSLPVSFKKLIGSIKIGLKVIEISDQVYLANKGRIDAAVEEADMGFLKNMGGISMLFPPEVLTEPGTKAKIDILQEFPYPTEFEPGKVVPWAGPSAQGVATNLTLVIPPWPSGFVNKDVGLSVEITTTINPAHSPDPGKIVLNGKFRVTQFDGFTQSNVTGVQGMPAFSTNESLFLEQLDDGEEIGFWIPGEHVALQNPRPAHAKPGWQNTAPRIKARYLLFVSANVVK